jgi:hypothetical protein
VGRFVLDKYYRLPQSVRQPLLVRQSAPYWLEARAVFIHIPRSAGSSFDLALYGRFMGHARASSIEKWGSRELQSLPWFAVARNPWDRLVSSYRLARRGAGVGGDFQAGVFRAEQYRVPEFESFDTFVSEWLTARDLRRLDPIFQPQTHFLTSHSGGRIIVDHVGRMENLAPTTEFLADYLGWTPALQHANRSGVAVDYREFYTPRLINLVGDLYAQDVKLLDYDFR